jgi:hypothetical protein
MDHTVTSMGGDEKKQGNSATVCYRDSMDVAAMQSCARISFQKHLRLLLLLL